jgi:hypothetical protein
MKKIIPAILILISAISVNAQNQADRWYFGMNAGMNFVTGAPYAIQGAIITTEGTTSASDSMGNLLFYSDGISVWDKNGTVMPNGSGLFGNISSTVSALAVPHPGNSNLHYIFTTDEAMGTNGFCYSVVDMSLQLGNGDVTLKNVPLLADVTEKITAVQQYGSSNYWVTTHEWGTDAFYSYNITQAGLQTTPVISHAGMVHAIDPLEQNKYGQMKFNTCGTKIAVAAGYLDTVQILDFDAATGMFSNAISLPLNDHVYGVEFSQDGSKLYVTAYNTSAGYANLVQYDLSLGTAAAILASMTVIATNNSGISFYYALQLGSDENIYVCTSWSQFLGRIDDPSVAGAGCNFNDMAFDLDPSSSGATAALGLPAFVQSYFRGEISCTPPLGLNEDAASELQVYPTASQEGFILNTEANELPLTVTIYDIEGRLILEYKNLTSETFTFGQDLSKGTYVLHILGRKNDSRLKIIKL